MLSPSGEPEIGSVGIRPSSSILSVLSHLNYKAWYAVAEFVDNSIQSYLSNRDELQRLHGTDFKLRVRVWLDQANQLIEVTDNAAGIRRADFPRAFRAAEIPTDRTGLSEFGMGMKTAACWFTPTWNVRSKALGESVERLVRFNLNEIIGGHLEHLPVIETTAAPRNHYTVLRLENLGKKFPVKRTQKKLRDHLASIYRHFLRSGELELYFDEEPQPMTFGEPEVLVASPYNLPLSPPIRWHKRIDIRLSGDRRVHGFAAIRQEASTTHAGFALFRRGRLILGSDDETYRPQDIFGNSNSFRYQRLFGELHTEGFEVSHTKDGFRWDDVEDELLEQLRESLRHDLDLLKQADNHRARPSKAALQPLLTQAGASMAADLSKTGGDALSIQGSGAGVYSASSRQTPDDVQLASVTQFSLLADDQKWNVTVRTSVDPSVTEWIRISKGDSKQLAVMPMWDIVIDVSMAHPFVLQFIGSKNENAELLLRLAAALALASEKSARAGYPVTLAVHWLNRLLRESLSGSLN